MYERPRGRATVREPARRGPLAGGRRLILCKESCNRSPGVHAGRASAGGGAGTRKGVSQ